MSSALPPPTSSPPGTPAAKREITLISHSMLFYWWPIWLLGFIMALVTYIENHRLAVLPPNTTASKLRETENRAFYELRVDKGQETYPLQRAVKASSEGPEESARAFPTRVSTQVWMGPIFCVVLILTVVITNVPLRGLWSFLVLLMMVMLALAITVVPGGWDKLLNALGHYFRPSLSPAAFNVATIACAIVLTPLMPRFGWPRIMAVALAAIVGGFGQIAVQWFALRGEGFRYRPSLNELDCIGIVVLKHTPTRVTFTLGHAYTEYYRAKRASS